MQGKPFWKSKTIWASLIGLVLAIGEGVLADVQEGDIDLDPELITTVGLVLAYATTLKGRLDADIEVYTPKGLPGKDKDELEPPEIQFEDTIDSEEHEGLDIELGNTELGNYYVKARKRTAGKLSTIDSTQLADNEFEVVLANSEVPILNWERAEGNHIYCQLANQPGLSVFFYVPDIELYNSLHNRVSLNTDTYVEQKKTPLLLPTGETVFLEDPILPNGNFYWYEATKNGQRVPADASVVAAIRRMAKRAQDVRELLGRPMIITSWYRDPRTNRRVGGASRSRHLVGDAIDFAVPGMTPQQVQQILDSPTHYWQGGMGYGWTYTHIDLGDVRRWPYQKR